MMKQSLAVFSIAVLTLTVATPTFAYSRDNDRYNRGNDGTEIRIENRANVSSTSRTLSNSGLNEANRNGDSGRIDTGSTSADALQKTEANLTEVETDVDCRCGGEIKVENNADIRSYSLTASNSGMNDASRNGTMSRQYNSNRYGSPRSEGEGVIVTGHADSLSTQTTLVNSTVVRTR